MYFTWIQNIALSSIYNEPSQITLMRISLNNFTQKADLLPFKSMCKFYFTKVQIIISCIALNKKILK